MNENIIDLMRFVMSVNSEDYHTHIEFSGHVECISISTYAGGFDEDKDFSIYLQLIPVSEINAEEVERIKAKISADMEKAVKND